MTSVKDLVEEKRLELCKLSLEKSLSKYKNPLNSKLGKMATAEVRNELKEKYVKVYYLNGKVFTSSYKKYQQLINDIKVIIDHQQEFRVLIQKKNKYYIQMLRFDKKQQLYKIVYEFEKTDNEAAYHIRPFEFNLDPIKDKSKQFSESKIFHIDPEVRKVKGKKIDRNDKDLQIIGGYVTWKDNESREVEYTRYNLNNNESIVSQFMN